VCLIAKARFSAEKNNNQSDNVCSGAEETLCLEAVMQNGWALQAATSHFLGQNFSKAFDCTFTNAAGAREHVWATSWGVSTRLIGACIMAHADDAGMVMPPYAAPLQVVVVPILGKIDAGSHAVVRDACTSLVARLSALGLRAACDNSAFTNGEKFYGLERIGVPLRIDVGARDIASGRLPVTSRVPIQQTALAAAGAGGSLQSTPQAKKFTISSSDDGKTVVSLVDAMHQQLLMNSASLMKEKVVFSHRNQPRKSDIF
jgi:prolyl-tRNA synthetase